MGNLWIEFGILFPTQLTTEQRDVLQHIL
jgi:hypothetical protein